jgi:ornithine cyclodeaminase
MLYLNKADILNVGTDWKREIDVVESAVKQLKSGDFSQPIKPYLRFPNPANRIIAMPAYLGGDIKVAGIKWIASFPGNLEKNLARANSVTVLNDAETGEPVSLINTSMISVIRTAAVSGLVVKLYEQTRDLQNINVGIVGFGPIGKYHLEMLCSLLGSRISKVYLYDIKGISHDELTNLKSYLNIGIEICNNWEETFDTADIFVTCTVSKDGYIDRKPKDGALLLNVSLRDFKPTILDYTQSIIVDNWEEVCREGTDVEVMHKNRGLLKEQTKSIVQIVEEQKLEATNPYDAIMFNPMGMAVFDVAMAHHYHNLALNKKIGVHLD